MHRHPSRREADLNNPSATANNRTGSAVRAALSPTAQHESAKVKSGSNRRQRERERQCQLQRTLNANVIIGPFGQKSIGCTAGCTAGGCTAGYGHFKILRPACPVRRATEAR